jgi:hypothetical protein
VGSEERWRSEGIQIGGRNSARGVFGNWFDKYGGPLDYGVFTTLLRMLTGFDLAEIMTIMDPLGRLVCGRSATNILSAQRSS